MEKVLNNDTNIAMRRRAQDKSYIFMKVEGIHHSYWLGKFFNSFIKKGKKKKIFKHLYLCFLQLKLVKKKAPLLYWFEMLERVKPTFRLIDIFPHKKKIVYPQVVFDNKQYSIVLRWIVGEIKEEYKQSRRNKTSFYKVVYSIFDYWISKKYLPLVNKRKDLLHKAIRLQDNIRYTWVNI